DAGELLDDQAKSAYRRRLFELREELEEAKALGKVATAGHLEEEIGALTSELSRAVGLGGRSRRAASASERARQTVTKTIRVARERIGRSHGPLGDFLSRCIKTGTFCSYQPDPDEPIAWEFAATNFDSTVQSAGQPAPVGETAPAQADRPQASAIVLDVSPFSF